MLTFNDADQVESVTTPHPGTPGSSPQTTFTYYDKSLRATNVVQPDGTTLTTEFHLTGAVKRKYGSRTYPVGYGYDYAGRMKTMTNWTAFPTTGARVTAWNYDPYRGWLTSKTYDGGAPGPIYSNTPAGRMALRIWARGTNTTYAYNNAGDLAAVSYSDGSPGISYGYSRLGRQSAITNGSSICSLTHDLAGPLLSESWSGGALDTLSITSGYDHLLRRTNLVLLNSTTPLLQHSMSYDAASRLKTITSSTNSFGYSYLANSTLIEHFYFTNNGSWRMTTKKQYDFLNRLTSISSASPGPPPFSSFAYLYNSANQRVRRTEADGCFWIFEYDPLGQVRSGKKYWPDSTPVAGQQFEYSHDDIGNRTGTKAGGDQNGWNLRSAGYAANSLNQYTNREVPGSVDILGVAIATNAVTVNGLAAHRKGEYFWKQFDTNNTTAPVYAQLTVSSAGSNIVGNVFWPRTQESFSYDADGNLTSDGRWNYFWDPENRLIAMAANTGVGPQISLRFEYEPNSRRIGKQVWSNTAWTGDATNDLRFVYDGWNLLASLNPQILPLNSFLWGLDLSGVEQGAGGISGLLSIWDAATIASQPSTHFPTFDGNGNLAHLLSASDSTISTRYECGPFGENLRATGPMAKANPFRFSTKYQDDETDLLYYGYRSYDPKPGRWINRDPSEELGGLNLYGFVLNNPQMHTDSFGLTALPSRPCSTCGSICDERRKQCRIKKKPTYDPPGGTTLRFTREGIKKTAVFTFVVEFEHDPTQSICAGCCEIRSFIKWSKQGYPVDNKAWVPRDKYLPETWYEDHTPEDKRYGYRSGPHSVGPNNSTIERFQDTDGKKNWLCGAKYVGQDTPTTPWAQKGQWTFQLKVVDICNEGRVIDTAPGPTIDWEKEEVPR